jgi:hypothetical protein
MEYDWKAHNEAEYQKKCYNMAAQHMVDQLHIDKSTQSDWCEITMITNGFENGIITLRSKEMAEQLHFMLGQLLDK